MTTFVFFEYMLLYFAQSNALIRQSKTPKKILEDFDFKMSVWNNMNSFIEKNLRLIIYNSGEGLRDAGH